MRSETQGGGGLVRRPGLRPVGCMPSDQPDNNSLLEYITNIITVLIKEIFSYKISIIFPEQQSYKYNTTVKDDIKNYY